MQLLAKDGVSDIDVGHANDTIEGTGVFGGGGFLSFRVSFRCIRGGKRISSAEVDDFRRGVMLGRADKGLLITTGKFTQEAVLKAASDRAPEIRLIDGEELVGKLKELQLGLRTEQVLVERGDYRDGVVRGVVGHQVPTSLSHARDFATILYRHISK